MKKMREQLASLLIFSLVCTALSMPTVPVYATEVVSDTEYEITDDSTVIQESEADQDQEEETNLVFMWTPVTEKNILSGYCLMKMNFHQAVF